MGEKNFHTNIMLDIECLSIEYDNPIILEVAAVHFDPDTGEELGHFHTPVSYQSCTDLGLVEDEETVLWVQKTIPDSLTKSKESKVSLEEMLFKLNGFIRRSRKQTEEYLKESGRQHLCSESQPMIWGNGAVADNVWIRSAYRACQMEMPHKFYNNMCVRTMVKQSGFITGRNFPRETKFKGTKHNPLDDCRHQVRYLVAALDAIKPPAPVRRRGIGLLSPETSFSVSNDNDSPVEKPVAELPVTPAARNGRPALPSPETSFSIEAYDNDDSQDTCTEPFSSSPPTARSLISPETSFSAADLDYPGQLEALDPTASRLKRPRTNRAPISPETSFTASHYSDDSGPDGAHSSQANGVQSSYPPEVSTQT